VVDIPGEVLWTRKEGSGALNVQAGGRFSLDHRRHWESLCRLLLHGPGIDMADLDERRSHGRMVHDEDLESQDMVLRDISRGGAGLLVRQPVVVGSWMDLLLEREDEPLQLRGRVLRCQEIVRGSVYRRRSGLRDDGHRDRPGPLDLPHRTPGEEGPDPLPSSGLTSSGSRTVRSPA